MGEEWKKVAREKLEEAEKKKNTAAPEEGWKEIARQKLFEQELKKVNDRYIDIFVDYANRYYSSAQEDYDKVGWGNAASIYQSKQTEWKNLDYRRKVIQKWLENNQDSLDPEGYKSLSGILSNFETNAPGILDSFSKARDFYSQFDTEDDYNKFLDYDAKRTFDLQKGQKEIEDLEAKKAEMLKNRRQPASSYLSGGASVESSPYAASQQKVNDLDGIAELDALISQKKQYLNLAKHIQEGITLSSVSGNTDFNEYSGYVSTESDGWWDKLTSDFGMGYDDVTYEYINGMDNGNRQKIIEKALAFDYDTEDFYAYDYMTPEQIAIYNYHYAKDGKEKAQEYLDSILESLNYQYAEERFRKMEGKTGVELLFGIEAGADQFQSGVKSLFNTKDDYIPQTAVQMASGMVREDLKTAGPNQDGRIGGVLPVHVGYDVITTTTNMAPSMLTSMAVGMINPAAGAVAGNALMFASSAGNAYQDALNRGYDKGQARMYSALVGGSEVGLQYMLGGISALGGKLSGKTISSMLEGVDNAFLRFAGEYGGKMISEGFEEGLQEILTPMFENMVFYTDENVNWEEVAYSFLLGSLTAGVMEGPSTVYSGVNTYETNREMKNIYGSDPGALVSEALEIDPENAFAQKMQERLDQGKDLSGGQLNRLVQQNEAAMTAQDMSAIQSATAQRLTELGETGDVGTIAAALAKQAAGEELSLAEERAIRSSKYGQRVANELNTENIQSGGYASGWAEQIGTNRINAQEYGRMVQAAQEELETATVPEKRDVAKNATGKESLPVAKKETTTQGVSDDGVTRQMSTGKEVTPQKIVAIDGGKVMIQTDGGTIAADDIEFGTGDTALLWRSAASFNGINTSGANGVIRAYQSGTPVTTYLQGAAQEFQNGYYNMESGGEYADKLTPTQRKIIYDLGQKAAGENTAKALTKATAARKQQGTGSKTERVGNVHFDRKGRTFDSVREVSLKTMEQLSRALGVEFYVYESYVNKAGERVYKDAKGNEVHAPNGWYDPKDGSIHIDLNAGVEGKGTMLFTVAHELTHFIKEWSPAKFKVLANFLVKQYGEKDVSVNKLVDAQIAKAKKNGRELSWDEAYEEMVADSMEAMLTDGNVVQMMAELKQQDKNLWQKICDWFKDLVADLKAIVDAYKGVKPDSHEGKLVSQMQDVIVVLESLYTDALADAGENYQAARAEKNTTREGGVKYSVRETTDGRFAAVVESDVLKDIDTSSWNQEKKRKAQAAASEALKQFSDGIVVDGVTRVVNRTSRREYTRSKDTARLYRDNTEVFADKMRAADVADDIVIAATDWNRDGGLTHPRTDDFVDFDHGQTLIMSGSAKYSAEVVVGITSKGAAVFYDVVDMTPTDFEIKNAEPHSTATTNESIGDMIGGSAESNVAQDAEEVKHESSQAMDLEVDAKTESVAPKVMFSERTWTESEYVQQREKAAQEIAKAIGVSDEKAKAYIDSVNGIAKMIANDRVRLDYFSSPGRSSFVTNVEYGGSFDFSTLCKKRRLLTGTFTAIQKALPNTALTANEILDIRNRMKDAGLEVSCGLCYVEGSRANMGQFAKEFLNLYKQYYPDAWQPNMADVNTPDGIEWVRINHPECYEQYEYFWNHYGTLKPGDKNLFASQQKPKLYQLHTEYKGEILDQFHDDDNVEEKNLNGGIRLQSFSDFEIVHLIDTMQIIMDMSRVGLAGQAYTKVPDFAWALGDTGLKINLSLIAKGVDENGQLIFDDVEGMPIDEAMALRERYSKNVGTIMVAFNDEQLLAAMADDRVDFIIPFHRSQWKKSQYEAMGLPAKTKDYTYMQNEKFIKPQYHEYRGRMVKDRATNYMPNEYWDFSKSGKENAAAYLEMCARNNKRPKFYKLLQNNGDGSYSLKADGSTDGYWKLLIDFKMYDNDGTGSPQTPVRPEFNMDEATRMLNAYSGGHSNFPVAQGIADGFVREYKESHKGMKFSDRDSDGNALSQNQQESFKDSKVPTSERDPELEKVNRVLEKENTELKHDLAYLKELLKLQNQVTGGTKFTKSSVEAAAGQLMKYADAKGNKVELARLLNNVYEYIAGSKELTWDGVKEAAQPAVDWLQSHVRNMTEADYGYDQELFGQELLSQVYDSYWNVSTLRTVADKAQKEINKLKFDHIGRMANLKKYHKEQTTKLKQEHRENLQRVRQELRDKAEKQRQDILARHEASRKKGAENRHKAEMRRKIRKTIRDLDKLLNNGDKKRNVKEGMKDLVSETLRSADILFTDNYSNEDMIRNGVGTDLTEQEAKYVEEARELMEQIVNLPSGSYEAFQKRQEQESKLQSKLNYRMSKLNDVFARERARLAKTKVSEVLGSLAEAYKGLEDSEQSYISGAFHENVYQYMLAVQGDVGGTLIRDMSMNQLEELHKAYTMVLTTVRNANKMFAANLKQTREQLGSQTIAEVQKAGGEHGLWAPGEDKISAFSWNNEKPVYAFERIGSETLKQLFENTRAGEDIWAKDMTEAREFYLEQARKHKYDSWDFKKQYKFTSTSGIDFSLNLEQIMSLYAYSKREQAHDHLMKGGFVFDGNTEVQVSKMGIKMTYLNKTAKAHNVSPAILGDIVSKLTAEQKAFVDVMQDYLSTNMGGKGNEVSMQMYGVNLFNEKYYFPLRSAGQYMERAKEADLKKQQGQISIVNSGFAKAITPKSSNPVVLSGFMDVWADHVNEMSMYHSFVLPMEDFRRVYNYSSPNMETGRSISVNSVIQDAYGEAATAYIDQLYRDLNGGAVSDPRETTAKVLMGKFKKAAVFASLSVVIQQPSAIGRAFAIISPKYFIGSKVDHKRHKALWAELKQYAPVTIIKEMGYFDTGMGKSAQDFIKGKEYHGLKEKAAALFTDGDYRDEVLGKAPALADELTWCAIWEAAKRETRANNPKMDVKSEEFLQLAGKRFTEVITKTQVYDSVLSRSANMRSKGAFMSMWTAFMAEPTTTINMVEDALRKAKKGDKKYAARAMGAVMTSVVINSLLVSLVYAMRDDDEDETFLEKYVQSFATEILDGINPITYYPFLKDVWSVMQGYDIERSDMSLISSLTEKITKLVQVYSKDTDGMDEDELAAYHKSVSDAWWGVLDYGTALAGIPVKNVRRDINGAVNMFRTISQDLTDRDTSWGSLIDKTWDDVKNAIPVVGWMPDTTAADKLYKATVKGDEAYQKRLESAYSSQTSLDNAIRKGLRANDSRIWEAAVAWNSNDLETYKRIAREIVAEGHFSQDNVVMAIQAEAKAMLPKESESTSESKAKSYFTAEKFAVAVSQGNGTMAATIKADIVDTAVKNGKTRAEAEKSFASSAKSEMKELFQDGSITQKQAVSALTSYFGYEKEDAEKLVGEWAFKNKYGFNYDDRADAYKSGEISASALKSVLMDVGGKTEEEAELQIQVYDWQKEGIDIGSGQTGIVKDYNDYCKAAGIDKKTYYDAYLFYDASGEEGVAYSKTKECMVYINNLPLTSGQKTALALCWWAEKTVNKYKLW